MYSVCVPVSRMTLMSNVSQVKVILLTGCVILKVSVPALNIQISKYPLNLIFLDSTIRPL